jgi:hypothetical protein
MRIGPIYAVLQVRNPVQVVLNKRLNLLRGRGLIKEGKEFQFEDQMIWCASEFLRDVQEQLVKHFPHMESAISQEKALVAGKSQGTSAVFGPGFIGRFYQGDLCALESVKKMSIFPL